jgi:hypothetical protein
MKSTFVLAIAISLLGTVPAASAQVNKLINADGTRNCQLEPEQFRERCEARNKAVRLCVSKKGDDFQLCVSEKIEDVGGKKKSDPKKK